MLIKGQWVDLEENEANSGSVAFCDPTNSAKKCHFVPNKDNDEATCSLGYFPFLKNVHR